MTSNPLDILAKLAKAPLVGAFVFHLQPVPASRPRVSKWGVYYAKPYREWQAAAKKLAADFEKHPAGTIPLFVIVESVIQKARTSKLTMPTPDVDNLAKGPLDVITQADVSWDDDKSISALLTIKRFADKGEEAHTRVSVYRMPHES